MEIPPGPRRIRENVFFEDINKNKSDTNTLHLLNYDQYDTVGIAQRELINLTICSPSCDRKF